MPAAAWVTLIIAALIIAITAVGLLRVIFHLRAIRATSRPERRHSNRQPVERVGVRCAPRTGRLFPHRQAVPRRLPHSLQARQAGTRPAT